MNVVFLHRDYGRIVGAYWSPKNSGFSYPQTAEAYLSADGIALVYAWRVVEQYDRHANGGRGGMVIVGREHSGTTAQDIERGKSIDPVIRQELQDALDRALQAKPAGIQPTGDDWGNIE